MPIELLDDIIEELADRKGIYGSHGDELVDGDVTCTQKAPCRMCFTCGLRDRIIAAVEVERRLVQPPADTREPTALDVANKALSEIHAEIMRSFGCNHPDSTGHGEDDCDGEDCIRCWTRDWHEVVSTQLSALMDTREPAEVSPLQEIYRIATQVLAEPGDETGVLTAICTLIEESTAGKPAEPVRE